jgi:DNA-binding MarR family transcriptional regulator
MSLVVDLPVVVARLRARLREEVDTNATDLSISQLAILSRLLRQGPSTAAELSAAEHVSQQAIAQSLVGLRSAGLVRSDPDLVDRRKSRISVMPAGQTMVEEMAASRDAWLARAIDVALDAGEQQELARAIELLGRLADAPT